MPNSEESLFSIADLASAFNISTRTIRFYESKALIAPKRVGSTRVFSKRDRARLNLILRGKRLGFSLRDISDYLSLYDADSLQHSQNKMLLKFVDQRIELLNQQREDLNTTLSELHEIRDIAVTRLAQAQTNDA